MFDSVILAFDVDIKIILQLVPSSTGNEMGINDTIPTKPRTFDESGQIIIFHQPRSALFHQPGFS